MFSCVCLYLFVCMFISVFFSDLFICIWVLPLCLYVFIKDKDKDKDKDTLFQVNITHS